MIEGSFGFLYPEDASAPLYRIISTGFHRVSDADYRWDGMERPAGGVLFQYTLAGEGQLTLGETRYTVPIHHGFFVHIPSEHRYWYEPAQDKPWEHIWLRFTGNDAEQMWSRFIRHYGPVGTFHPDSEPIRLLYKLYEDAASNRLRDRYEVSVRLYEWMLAMLRETEGKGAEQREIPEKLRHAKVWLEQHYRMPLGLDQAAMAAGMSKHHFCKMFLRFIGITPMQYVRQLRIEEAARLLRHTSLPITVIAAQTGFDNSSYFGKVFRQMAGMSPSDFREGVTEIPYGALRFVT